MDDRKKETISIEGTSYRAMEVVEKLTKKKSEQLKHFVKGDVIEEKSKWTIVNREKVAVSSPISLSHDMLLLTIRGGDKDEVHFVNPVIYLLLGTNISEDSVALILLPEVQYQDWKKECQPLLEAVQNRISKFADYLLSRY